MIVQHRDVVAVVSATNGEYTFLMQGCSILHSFRLARDANYVDYALDEIKSKINALLDGLTSWPLAAISDAEYMRRIETARREIADKKKAIAQLQHDIDNADREVNAATKDLLDEFEELKRMLMRMERESAEKIDHINHDGEPEFEEADSDSWDRQRQHNQDREDAEFNRAERRALEREANKEARRILRKIFGMCHPDRTTDKFKHDLFDQARKCGLNLPELQGILEKAVQRGTTREVELLLQECERELAQLEGELLSLESSPELKVANLLKTHRDAVIAQARHQIKISIQRLQGRIEQFSTDAAMREAFAQLNKGYYSAWE